MNDGQGQVVSLPVDLFLTSYEVLVRTMAENLNLRKLITEVRNGFKGEEEQVASEGNSQNGEEGD
jgi:hypothetical protein